MTLIPLRRRDEEFRERAISDVPGFAESGQYQLLTEADRRIPGLVFAALTAFCLSTQEALLAGQAERDAPVTLDATLHLLEEMAESADDSVTNLLVTEVFENLGQTEASGLLRQRLGPEADGIYRRWIERTSH